MGDKHKGGVAEPPKLVVTNKDKDDEKYGVDMVGDVAAEIRDTFAKEPERFFLVGDGGIEYSYSMDKLREKLPNGGSCKVRFGDKTDKTDTTRFSDPNEIEEHLRILYQNLKFQKTGTQFLLDSNNAGVESRIRELVGLSLAEQQKLKFVATLQGNISEKLSFGTGSANRLMVLGLRRSGKTTLLRLASLLPEVLNELREKGHLFFWYDFRTIPSGSIFDAFVLWIRALERALQAQLPSTDRAKINMLCTQALRYIKLFPFTQEPSMCLRAFANLPFYLANTFGFSGIWCVYDEFDKTFPILTYEDVTIQFPINRALKEVMMQLQPAHFIISGTDAIQLVFAMVNHDSTISLLHRSFEKRVNTAHMISGAEYEHEFGCFPKIDFEKEQLSFEDFGGVASFLAIVGNESVEDPLTAILGLLKEELLEDVNNLKNIYHFKPQLFGGATDADSASQKVITEMLMVLDSNIKNCKIIKVEHLQFSGFLNVNGSPGVPLGVKIFTLLLVPTPAMAYFVPCLVSEWRPQVLGVYFQAAIGRHFEHISPLLGQGYSINVTSHEGTHHLKLPPISAVAMCDQETLANDAAFDYGTMYFDNAVKKDLVAVDAFCLHMVDSGTAILDIWQIRLVASLGLADVKEVLRKFFVSSATQTTQSVFKMIITALFSDVENLTARIEYQDGDYSDIPLDVSAQQMVAALKHPISCIKFRLLVEGREIVGTVRLFMVAPGQYSSTIVDTFHMTYMMFTLGQLELLVGKSLLQKLCDNRNFLQKCIVMLDTAKTSKADFSNYHPVTVLYKANSNDYLCPDHTETKMFVSWISPYSTLRRNNPTAPRYITKRLKLDIEDRPDESSPKRRHLNLEMAPSKITELHNDSPLFQYNGDYSKESKITLKPFIGSPDIVGSPDIISPPHKQIKVEHTDDEYEYMDTAEVVEDETEVDTSKVADTQDEKDEDFEGVDEDEVLKYSFEELMAGAK